jgi:putative phosphoribosyl transferase
VTLQHRLPLHDRRQAGELLAAELDVVRTWTDLMVLGLPRGGVPVAWQVARALHAPMDVFVVRKIGLPSQPEYAVGAIASGDVCVMDPVPPGFVSESALREVVLRETAELRRREQAYRGGRPRLELNGRSVLLVDDGIATGATMEAAVRAVRKLHPRCVAVASPVGSAAAAARLRPLVDQLVFGAQPEPFVAVGRWYREFPQCSDEEVQALLVQAWQPSVLHH